MLNKLFNPLKWIHELTSHENDKGNPHEVTVDQIGAETPAGAQGKADAAQAVAQTYTDNKMATGNAATATKMATARTIAVSGDATGNVSFDGSDNATIPLTLTNTGVAAGTYTKITTDGKGRVMAGATLVAADIPILTHDKISDFDSWVRTNALNQLATPTGIVDMGGFKITSLGPPISDMDAANKAYVDAARNGIQPKDPVRVASTANVNIATGGLLTIDGIALSAGDRVLLKNQTSAAENGIYIAATGAWNRSSDADNTPQIGEVKSGMSVWVSEGSTLADTQWVLTTKDAITLGTTALTFTQVSGLGQVSTGIGISKSGNTLSLASGVATSGTYRSVTVDTYGRVTGGTNPTTLAGYGITDALPVTGTAVAANKLATARTIGASGDVIGVATSFDGSGNITIPLTLALSGVTAGTYNSVTVDAKGRVTGGTNCTTLASLGINDAYTKTEADSKYALLNGTIANANNLGNYSRESIIKQAQHSDFDTPISATFIRSTVAYNTDGTQVAANVPRYNNGVLVEEGTTNLAVPATSLVYDSSKFSVEYLDSNRIKITALVASSGLTDGYHCGIQASLTIPANTAATLSVIKISESTPGAFIPGAQGFGAINSIGSGKYSRTITHTAVWTHVLSLAYISGTIGSNFAVGDWVIFEFPQIEQKPYPTSYIPPGSTRSPENLTIPASVLNTAQGTIELEVCPNYGSSVLNSGNVGSHDLVFATSDTTKGFILRHGYIANTFSLLSRRTAGNLESDPPKTFSAGDKIKLAVKWDSTSVYLYINGVLSSTLTMFDWPTGTDLYVGSRLSSTPGDSIYSNLRVSNTAHSDTKIAADATLDTLPMESDTTCLLPLTSRIDNYPMLGINRILDQGGITAGSNVSIIRDVNSNNVVISLVDSPMLIGTIDIETPSSDSLNWGQSITNTYNANVTGYGTGIKFKNGITSETNKWVGIAGIADTGWANTMALAFYTLPTSASPPVERMRITGSGSTGIGTPSPDATAKLHLSDATYGGIMLERVHATYPSKWNIIPAYTSAGDLTFYDSKNSKMAMILNTTTSTGAQLVIPSTQANTDAYNWLTFRNSANGYGTWGFKKISSNDLGLYCGTNDNNPSNLAMYFKYGGNVGLGAITSSDQLPQMLNIRGTSSGEASINVAGMYNGLRHGYLFGNGLYGYLDYDTSSNSVRLSGYGPLVFGHNTNAAHNSETFTEIMRLASNGVISLAYGQLQFPSAPNPSSNANTLDDYEEGTWTPTITGSTTNPSVTYTLQYGEYTKIGNIVHAHIRLVFNITTGGVGDIYVSLPFASAGAQAQFMPVAYCSSDSVETVTALATNINTAVAVLRTNTEARNISNAATLGIRGFDTTIIYKANA